MTDDQKKMIKNSQSAFRLLENIQEVQRENYLAHAKAYFKNFIYQELKKLKSESNLNDLMTYEKEIDKKRSLRGLMGYVRQIVKEIKEGRSNKITSIRELKELAKKNISETLAKEKIKTKELHPRHQN